MSDTRSADQHDRALPTEGSVEEDPLAAAREETITVLSECFARDILTVEDFERRAELVHGARTMADLGTAIEGVRSGDLPARAGAAAGAAAQVRPRDHSVAVFAETKREGQWIPARRNTAVAVMGSAVIDLREALLGPEQTVVSAIAFMGGVEVIVPPGVRVECSGSAVFGAFEQRREFTPFAGGLDAPLVRVEGFAMFGSVEIEHRRPGESRREARRRRKREKKERKRLQR